ncbi:unnamed protein product, partial [Aphanomyces euteiches]
MFAMYEFQGKCTSMVQVYSHLIDLEADYFADRSVNNFAHTVHRLHPLTYRYRDAPPYYYKINRKPAKEAFSKCPHPDCHHTLPIESMYKSHVKGETITCGQCGKKIPTPAFGIASFIKHTPQFSVQYEVKATMKTITVVTPPMPEDGNLKIFMAELQSRIKEQAPQASRKAMEDLKEQVRVKVLEHINPFKVISYDLDLVLAMIRQLDFVNKICAHMEYWNNPTVIQASIIRYHKFMHLFTYKQYDLAIFVPTSDIDLVWHTHQADDSKYREFCMTNFNRRVIDHDDTVRRKALEDGFKETYLMWLQAYGEFYSSYLPTCPGMTNDNDSTEFPSHDCRFVGVNEPFAMEALPYATAVVPDKLAVENAETPPSNNLPVYLTVIGTSVMDGRVRLKYSRQSYVMGQGQVGYVNVDGSQGNTKGGCVGNYGHGRARGTGGCAYAGCASTGCGSGGC